MASMGRPECIHRSPLHCRYTVLSPEMHGINSQLFDGRKTFDPAEYVDGHASN